MASLYEEIKVLGQDLVETVKSKIHEGNIRRIIIKDTKGHTFIEIPVTVAALTVIAAPILAAVGAIAAHVAHFTVVVEKANEAQYAGAATSAAPPPAAPTGPGATEDQVNMRGTVGGRIDSRGSKVDDLAGTGKEDAPGG